MHRWGRSLRSGRLPHSDQSDRLGLSLHSGRLLRSGLSDLLDLLLHSGLSGRLDRSGRSLR